MTEEHTIKELVGRSARGDTSSFRLLTEQFDEKLFSYILSRAKTREDALDVLQDVLVDIWKALPTFVYKSDAEFYGFLYTITKRRLYTLWGAKTTVQIEDEGSIMDGKGGSIEERLAVEDALAKLDEIAREIVLLKHWSRYSFGEIGTILSMGESAVRVRHHRALKTLHTLLDQHA